MNVDQGLSASEFAFCESNSGFHQIDFSECLLIDSLVDVGFDFKEELIFADGFTVGEKDFLDVSGDTSADFNRFGGVCSTDEFVVVGHFLGLSQDGSDFHRELGGQLGRFRAPDQDE